MLALVAIIALVFQAKNRENSIQMEAEEDNREIQSFWDVARRPEMMSSLSSMEAEAHELASQIRDSPEQIADLVDFFIFEGEEDIGPWFERIILMDLGELSHPKLIEILRDPSLREALVVPDFEEDESRAPSFPLGRLCYLFDADEATPPAEAAPLIAPFLSSTEDEIRKRVALALGSIGTSETVEPLRAVLKDEDEYVQSYALMGIQRAIDGDRLAEEARDPLFDAVSEMWATDISFNVAGENPIVLLKLDRERAKARLLKPDLFSADFKRVHEILEAFSELNVEVPRQQLLTLIEETELKPLDEYPVDYILDASLNMLGSYRNPEDLPRLEAALESENSKVVLGAVIGLYRFHDVFNRIRNVYDVIQSEGWVALTDVERRVMSVEELDGEVNNGGFAQYFFNSGGNNWQDALAGLEAMGAKGRAAAFKQVLARFPDGKPAVDRDIRGQQLAKILEEGDDPFAAQDKAWYDSDENLDRLLYRYNMANIKARLPQP